MKKLILSLLFLTLLFATSCKNNKPAEQDASMALPHSKDVPQQNVSQKDKEKILNAKGKKVEGISFLTFQNMLKTNNQEKLYIYNFWSTSCKPCIEEMPYFETLQEAYPDKIQLTFVSLDNPADLQEKVIPFIREREIKSEVVLITDNFGNNEIEAVSSDWDGTLPATLFINPAQKVRLFKQQTFSFEELKAFVLPLTL